MCRERQAGVVSRREAARKLSDVSCPHTLAERRNRQAPQPGSSSKSNETMAGSSRSFSQDWNEQPTSDGGDPMSVPDDVWEDAKKTGVLASKKLKEIMDLPADIDAL